VIPSANHHQIPSKPAVLDKCYSHLGVKTYSGQRHNTSRPTVGSSDDVGTLLESGRYRNLNLIRDRGKIWVL
jgi:hypothetical protein